MKEWTTNIVLVDLQGYKKHKPMPPYDYQKLFDGPIRLLSDMSESDVRNEIVRLLRLNSYAGQYYPRIFLICQS